MDTVKNVRRGQIPSPNSYVLGQFHKHCLHFGFLHLVFLINLFLLSEQILFLCRVNRVNFPHFEILAPLSRQFPLLGSDFSLQVACNYYYYRCVLFCFMVSDMGKFVVPVFLL